MFKNLKNRVIADGIILAVFILTVVTAFLLINKARIERVPDYSSRDSWAYFAVGDEKDVDLFLIAPTVYTGDRTNMSIGDRNSLTKFTAALNMERGIYEKVCQNLREKLDKGEKIFPVSLNFSRLDFELMDAVSQLEKLVEKYEIPKEYLHVEITESALTDETNTLKTAMEVLHEKGYSIWLDDFGSGYSSLNVLKDYNFDVLKIDMVFLKNFEDEQVKENARKIIGTILDLACALNMKTLTEGVESEEATQFLTEKGCGRLQGYFYGKPMSFEEIYEAIHAGKLEISSEIL